MMPRTRMIGLLMILLVARGWCKPTKASEGEDYNDDEYTEEEDTSIDEETENGGNIESTVGGPEDAPQIISRPKNIYAYEGSIVVLPCEVVNVDGLAVMWKRVRLTGTGGDQPQEEEFLWSDDTPITSEPNRIVRSKNNTLIIHDARTNDTSDRYVCSILTNRKDIKQPEIAYKVRIEPKSDENSMSSGPQDRATRIHVSPSGKVEVKQGETLTIGCRTNLRPAPRIKWFQKNKRVHGGVETADGNFLTIRNIGRHHAGVYQCLAEIGTGQQPPLGVIEVIVRYSPVIEVESESVHTGINVDSKLSCMVHAHPRARVMWYNRDGREIIPKKGVYVMKDEKNRHELEIVRTSGQDLGRYTCRAVNEIGEDTKTITLTGAPSQPAIYSGEMTKGATALMLKWRLESYSPITEYILKYRSKEDGNWTIASPPVTTGGGSGNRFIAEHTIEGLRPGSYEAILLARNAYGFSLPSVPYAFTAEYNTDASASAKGSATTTSTPRTAVTASLLVVVLYCAFVVNL